MSNLKLALSLIDKLSKIHEDNPNDPNFKRTCREMKRLLERVTDDELKNVIVDNDWETVDDDDKSLPDLEDETAIGKSPNSSEQSKVTVTDEDSNTEETSSIISGTITLFPF